MKWVKGWQPEITEGLPRVVLLDKMRGAVQRSNYWRDGERVDRWIVKDLLRTRVLTTGQIANVLGISRAYVYQLQQDAHIENSVAPRGLLTDHGLELMNLVVCQLHAGTEPATELLGMLPYCGDISIVSYLTGVPRSVINRYRVRKEEFDGTDYRQRVAHDPRVRDRAV